MVRPTRRRAVSQHGRREPRRSSGAAPPRGVLAPVRRFLRILGPGFITGASDDDPSGIGTYASAGAALGYSALWTAPLSFPMMAAVQFMCAKIGLVTGRGLAGVIREHYPRVVLYPVVITLALANAVNAGVDIGAIAAAINMLVPIPIWVMILPIALVILVMQIWGSYRLITTIFKWLTLALLAYIGASIFARPAIGEVLRGTLLPTIRFDSTFLGMLVAILGTTISPYLFFWQASEEVEEEISIGRRTLRQRKGATARELRMTAWDVQIGMLFSNLVMYFIILATAATLHRAGHTEIRTAVEAAQALRPLAGNAASLLLALGLIGSGYLAVPVLTGSSAYALAEAFGWRRGLDEKPRRAPAFYATIALSTLVGILVDFAGISPIRALVWVAVMYGFLSPPLLVLIMLIATDSRIMGTRVNSRGVSVLGWGTTVVMFLAAAALVTTWVR